MDGWICGHTSRALWKLERNCLCQGMFHFIYFNIHLRKRWITPWRFLLNFFLLGRIQDRLLLTHKHLHWRSLNPNRGIVCHLALPLPQIIGATQFTQHISVKKRESFYAHSSPDLYLKGWKIKDYTLPLLFIIMKKRTVCAPGVIYTEWHAVFSFLYWVCQHFRNKSRKCANSNICVCEFSAFI